MKIKLGTQVERETYQNLKIAAAREERAISEIVQEAIQDYLHKHSRGKLRSPGLGRLLEPDPLRLTRKQIRESLSADFFDQ